MRSRTILPRIFKSIAFHLIGFCEPWLFNYPLTLILYFSTLNLMDWHGTIGVPSLDVSLVYDSNLSSIHWGNPKLLVRQCKVPNLGINGCEGKRPRIFRNVLFNYLVTLEFLLTYPHVHKPLFSTLWASFAPFIFGESERSLGVRAYLTFSKGKRTQLRFFKFFHSIQVFRVRKHF